MPELPRPAEVPVLWIGTAERVSAIVEMNHPGTWVLGDTTDAEGHGSVKAQQYWGPRGLDGENLGACNTWAVNADKVK